MPSRNSFDTRASLTSGAERFTIFSLAALEKAGFPAVAREFLDRVGIR